MLSNTPSANAGVLRLAPRRSTVRMMSQEGQIQSELMESMRAKIQTALDAQSVSVSDVQGDGRHVEIVVVSNQFEGQNSVNRQRMVYKAIWEELQDVVHAVRHVDPQSIHHK
jgi:stress-induced morphogen